MFENVLGHEKEKRILEQSVVNKNISHAYTFYGKEGIGKSLLALEFAKQLLNTDNLQNNVDFKYITKAEDKQNILVEQIRDELIQDIYIAPALSEYKVYVIDEADKMNLAAQNTLLKTLEEPPKSVVIILITSNIDGLIGTILSRTTNIFLNKLSDEDIKQYITRNNMEIDSKLLAFADGSIKTLLTILNNGNMEKFENVKKLISAIDKKQKLQAINLMKDIDLKDNILVEYIEFLLLQNNFYDKISLIEQAKNALKLNANEDMQKTTLAIKLLE